MYWPKIINTLPKTLFMKWFFYFLLVSSLSFAQKNQTKTFAEKKVVLTPFVNLKIYSGITIKLIRSEGDSLMISSEAPDEVVSVLKGNTLKLRLGLESLLQKLQTHITIYHSQPLDVIDLSQGSQMTSLETIKQTSLSLILQEGARAEIDMDVEKFSAKVQSGSKLFPSGKAKNIIISTSSGGACEADQLISEQADVKASLGGIVYVNATQLVDAKASLNATIRVHGKPQKLVTKESVGGRVIEMQ